MGRAFRVLATLLAVVAVVLVGAYYSYRYFHPVYAYRYRLTLEVELPDGSVRSGSSVVAVNEWRTSPRDHSSPNVVHDSLVGEATQVDLGDGRLLVALLLRWKRAPGQEGQGWGERPPTRGSPTGVLVRAYGLQGRGWEAAGPRNELLPRLARQRGAREIGPDDMPDLVTFADASDPRTVAEVDPRDLAASFGPGVRLRRTVVEVTGDPVTNGAIEQRLPWLRRMEGRSLAGTYATPGAPCTGLAGSIGRLSFKMGPADGFLLLY